MGTLLIALRLLLAAVFVTAGVGKLLDRSGSRAALGEFGVPAGLTRAGAILLPLCELAVSIALLLKPSARWGALGALLLLVAFMIGIAVAMAGGRAPECHCFGQIHSEPAGRSTLARNAVLGALAVVVAGDGPGPSIDGWLTSRSTAGLVWSAAAVIAVAGTALLWARWSRAQARRRLERPPGLPLFAPAPEFELSHLDGGDGTLGALTAAGRSVILVFAHPDCGPCAELLPHLARWQEALAERLTIAVVSQGALDLNRQTRARYQLRNVLVEREREVYESYAIGGTPSAVVVSADGQIASPTAEGWLQIEELVRQALHRGVLRPALAAA